MTIEMADTMMADGNHCDTSFLREVTEFDTEPLSEDLEWDYTCSMPLPHLSFIIKHFMSVTNSILNQSGEFLRNREKLRMKYEEIYKDVPDKPFLVGSTFDGLLMPTILKRRDNITALFLKDQAQIEKIMIMGDIDVMTVAHDKLVGNSDQPFKEAYLYHIESQHTLPGYLRLTHVDPLNKGSYIIHRDNKAYLSSSKIMAEMIEQGRNTISPQITVEQTGPAMTITEPQTSVRDTDNVLSLVCPVWPKQANEWVKRNHPSMWPPEHLRQEIIAAGCHVVPVAHKKSDWPEVEWRLSFAQAEQKLSTSLTIQQKQCYLTLKAIVKYELSPPDLLSSYCLKNHMFMCLEKIPKEIWEDEVNGLGVAFLYIIDELLYALINEHLPHYFQPSNNLITNISQFFLDELMAKVSKLRQDPVKYLLSFDKHHFFLHTSITTTLQTMLKPVLDDCKHFHNKLDQCYIAQCHSLILMCSVFLQECNFSTAYAISEAICAIGRHLNKNLTAINCMESHLLKLSDPKKASLGFEYIKDTIPDLPETFLGNLACMYTSLYSSEPDGPTKEKYRQRADENFLQSINQEVRMASGVDYSIFLRKCHRSQDAIPLLVKVLAQDRDYPSFNMYGKSEKCSLDEHLQEEIASSDNVTAPSLLLAFYQLAHCYMETKKIEKAMELMPDFSAACQQHQPQEAFIYSLLGYTYMDLNDYRSAGEAFSKAVQIKPDYELANHNCVLCEDYNT